ncbi:Arc family DNA-binding protein [Nonomuraea sp. NPDC026600]|uniref:Arc family DNA-binding protein n=1 Tax=Nonomuraea sp. NPDC026600 TaxID=3155363 RepID=UPI0033FC3807
MSGSRRGPDPKLGVPLGKKSFPLRLPDDLRDLMKERADEQGMSFNEYLVRMAARYEGYKLAARAPASAQEALALIDDDNPQQNLAEDAVAA